MLEVDLPEASVGVWHDRAVFHFLTADKDQQRYVQQVLRVLKPGGHVVISTFTEDGPTRCSGLDVQRYSPRSLGAVFGSSFRLLQSRRERHVTPAGREQAFIYCMLEVT